jgi:cell division initiation protein
VALSPEDIVNHEFKQALRGYAVQEVDDLLDRLADQLERAERDIADLRQRLGDADARLAEALATESSLKRTLITAQDAAQRTMDDAQAHADTLRSDADREANERLEDALARSASMLEEAESEADTIRSSYRGEQEAAASRVAELAAIEDRYRTQLRRLLERQLAELEVLEASGTPGGREVAELREALHGVVREDAGDDGAPIHDDGRDEDDESLVPFGGLTVRVRDDEAGEPQDVGEGLVHGAGSPDAWGVNDGFGEPDRDPSA